MDAAQDHTVLAGAVIQNELQQLLALGHGGALLDLHGPEVGLGKGLEVHELLEQGLNLHLGEVHRALLGKTGVKPAFLVLKKPATPCAARVSQSRGFIVGNIISVSS